MSFSHSEIAEMNAVAVEIATVDTLSKLFIDNGGDLDKLAAATGSDAGLMHKNMPAGAAELLVLRMNSIESQ